MQPTQVFYSSARSGGEILSVSTVKSMLANISLKVNSVWRTGQLHQDASSLVVMAQM